jgi:hypothetical protein
MADMMLVGVDSARERILVGQRALQVAGAIGPVAAMAKFA